MQVNGQLRKEQWAPALETPFDFFTKRSSKDLLVNLFDFYKVRQFAREWFAIWLHWSYQNRQLAVLTKLFSKQCFLNRRA